MKNRLIIIDPKPKKRQPRRDTETTKIHQGQVVGVTTAIVTDSQGLGFAIPSSAILREIESLITEGSYNQHPWIGASGMDMTYDIAKKMDVNVTYGWLIAQVTSGGPADDAGLQGGTRQVTIAG